MLILFCLILQIFKDSERGQEKKTGTFRMNVQANANCVELLVWAIADETGNKTNKNKPYSFNLTDS